MALKNCKDCNAEMSKKAPACPQCGAPAKKKTSVLTGIFGIFFILIIIGYIGNLGEDNSDSASAKSSKPSVPAMQVGVIELIDAYEANEVGADIKYKGKRIKISGTVRDIKKAFGGSLYVIFHKGGKYSFDGIQLYFDDSYTTSLGKLNKGERITVECTVKGLMSKVQLKKCTSAK